MAAYAYKRKLTVIFSADVAGYSELMGEDEAGTVQTLEAYRKVMFSMVDQHRGRVVDSPGDNLLAEFASVVDAVQSGVAIQNKLGSRNTELPENRRMVFRIGINLGDVRAPEKNNSTAYLSHGPSTALHPPTRISICAGGCAL